MQSVAIAIALIYLFAPIWGTIEDFWDRFFDSVSYLIHFHYRRLCRRCRIRFASRLRLHR